MINLFDLYKLLKELITDLSNAYNERNIKDLNPFLDALIKDNLLLNKDRVNLEKYLKEMMDSMLKLSNMIVEIRDYPYLYPCAQFININNIPLNDIILDTRMDTFEEFVINFLKINISDLNKRSYLAQCVNIWNSAKITDKEKIINLIAEMVGSDIGFLIDQINQIYHLDEILQHWKIIKNNSALQSIIQYFQWEKDMMNNI